MTGTKITFNYFIKQMVSDWFGKEVQTGYTYTYLWMANQFGHFNLGFLFSFLTYFIFKSIWPCGCFEHWLWVIPVFQLTLWTVKEIFDYNKAVHDAEAKNIFPVIKKDIALDAATAVLFISFGFVTAFVSWFKSYYALISFVTSLLIAFVPAYYWMVRKMYFQQAGLPFQYRLSDFPNKLRSSISGSDSDSPALVNKISEFINGDLKSWKHIVVFGEYKTGKTSLVVGVGTEKAFIKTAVSYTTYFKFLQLLSDNTSNSNSDGYQVMWNWNEVDILIVDDVNPAINDISITSPAEFEDAFNKISTQNTAELLQRKTLWAMGLQTSDDDAMIDRWHAMYARVLKCEKQDIGVIVLK